MFGFVHPSRRLLGPAVLAAVGGWAVMTASRDESASNTATNTPAAEPATIQPAPQATVPNSQTLPGPPILGFAINAHHIDDLSVYLASVDRIAEVGANALIVVTPMFQQHVDSTDIRYLPGKCPTDEQLLAILARAKQRHLSTTLLPIVLIENPGEKDWRGVISPRDWDAWWVSYDRLIDRFLDIAVAAEVDRFCIGSELNTTESQIDRWRRIVQRVRSRYKGTITYSANWDRYDKVTIWPLVDVMSVSAYFELARDEPDAPVQKLREAWVRERDRLLLIAQRYDRPLMITEVGYPSLPSAAAFPWDYVAADGVMADHEAQARCYEAFFGAWSEVVSRPDSPVLGFHCYYWDPYHHGDRLDTGYGVDGKPALKTIADGFRAIRRRVAKNTS